MFRRKRKWVVIASRSWPTNHSKKVGHCGEKKTPHEKLSPLQHIPNKVRLARTLGKEKEIDYGLLFLACWPIKLARNGRRDGQYKPTKLGTRAGRTRGWIDEPSEERSSQLAARPRVDRRYKPKKSEGSLSGQEGRAFQGEGRDREEFRDRG
jgi:hypothetical protein